MRITHREVSLQALGQLMNPPMTKDAVAGRIRRLLALADTTARRSGMPDTTTALTPNTLDQP
jgi:DNA-binding transcriptional regulator WhiA